MRSPNNFSDCRSGRLEPSHTPRGFTLLEIVIALGLVAIIFSFGQFVGLDLYRAHVFRSDELTLVTLLSKARRASLHRIEGAAHGVRMGDSLYILFTGASYAARDQVRDIEFPASQMLSRTGLSEVVFTLDGRVNSPGVIALTSGARTRSIVITREGGIDAE